MQWPAHAQPQRSAPVPKVFCTSLVTFFLNVGRTFISVAIVTNTHVHCPQFQQQQKDSPGLYVHDVFHMRLDLEDTHVVTETGLDHYRVQLLYKGTSQHLVLSTPHPPLPACGNAEHPLRLGHPSPCLHSAHLSVPVLGEVIPSLPPRSPPGPCPFGFSL